MENKELKKTVEELKEIVQVLNSTDKDLVIKEIIEFEKDLNASANQLSINNKSLIENLLSEDINNIVSKEIPEDIKISETHHIDIVDNIYDSILNKKEEKFLNEIKGLTFIEKLRMVLK